MHGPGTIVLKQDTPKAPIVRLTGVWYAPEAAHRLLSVTALTSQGFSCKITDKTKIWDKQGKLVIQASALLPSTPLHWFWSKLITPEGAVYSLQKSNSYHLWHLHLGHTSKNALCHAHNVTIPLFLFLHCSSLDSFSCWTNFAPSFEDALCLNPASIALRRAWLASLLHLITDVFYFTRNVLHRLLPFYRTDHFLLYPS